VIHLNDGKPWFRRWGWIGYRPITREGRLLTAVAGFTSLAAGVIAFLTNGAWPWTEPAFAVAIPAVIGLNAIAFFKMEDRF
jgi:hypothetical protein